MMFLVIQLPKPKIWVIFDSCSFTLPLISSQLFLDSMPQIFLDSFSISTDISHQNYSSSLLLLVYSLPNFSTMCPQGNFIKCKLIQITVYAHTCTTLSLHCTPCSILTTFFLFLDHAMFSFVYTATFFLTLLFLLPLLGCLPVVSQS